MGYIFFIVHQAPYLTCIGGYIEQDIFFVDNGTSVPEETISVNDFWFFITFKMASQNCEKAFFCEVASTHCRYPVGQKFRRIHSISHHFRDKHIFAFNAEIQNGRQK